MSESCGDVVYSDARPIVTVDRVWVLREVARYLERGEIVSELRWVQDVVGCGTMCDAGIPVSAENAVR